MYSTAAKHQGVEGRWKLIRPECLYAFDTHERDVNKAVWMYKQTTLIIFCNFLCKGINGFYIKPFLDGFNPRKKSQSVRAYTDVSLFSDCTQHGPKLGSCAAETL